MRVFISHASHDQALANDLASAVRAAGMSVWTPDFVSPGTNWHLEVGKALEQSDVMIVLFTPGGQHSSTLKQEVQYALTEGNYRGRVVPVLVNSPTFQAGTDVPWVLLRLTTVHLQGNPPDFGPVVRHLVELSRADCNATA